MDSALIYLIKQSRGEKIADVPTLQLDVQPDAQGLVAVDMKGTVSSDLLAAIKAGGGEVLNQVASERAIRAMLPVAAMETLAARPDVQGIRIADKGTTNLGSVVTEGDRTHRADTARATFGATGSGIKVGVLSDGVNSLANSIANGNLNAVTVLPGQAGSGDEGTAMLEIVQDLVPNAQLYFATANTTTAQFAQNIRDLATAGCSVIVDDYTYYIESPFQDATIAQAVNTVSAAGVMYFSSARNSGSVDMGTAGTWEGDFADGGSTALDSKGGNVHSFGSGYTYNTVMSGGSQRRVDLFWADPLGASNNDYDLFVTDSTGAVLRSSTTTQNGAQDPYESLGTLNVGERIVIVKTSTAASRFLHLDTGRAVISIGTPGNVRGHNAAVAANAFSVAATNVANSPSPAVFVGGATNPIETFSSDGPRRMFFNSDGTAMTPGNFSSTGGQVFQKPDITAADGVSTSVGGFSPFFGTSAAAPHAAAIAALIKSSNSALTPAQIRAAMAATALDIQGVGFDRDSGSGIVMAYPAMQAISTPSIASFSPGSGLPNTSVIISGIGFFNATSVSFNGTSATFTVNSPAQITATVPAGATTGPITVVGPLGTATSASNFTVFGFSPGIGTAGTSVLLTGSGFTGATAVSFNGTSASFTVNSDTQITAVVPTGATAGPISVTAPGGPITSSTSFTALSGDGTPTVASFTPATGAVGSSVTITGTNYVNVTNVAFNGIAATSFTVNSQTQITATVPVPSGSVTGNISVTTGYGTGTSSSTFTTLATLATYNAMTDVPVTGNGFTASGPIYVSLNFAPLTGTNLTLVNNTGLSFISGTYNNLSQGQVLTLNYNGVAYNFAVNYYGGTGNDLVLQWASNRAVGWGLDNYSQLGNNNSTNVILPTAITTSGVLAGRTVSKVVAGGSHTLALCTDGTLVAWGSNGSGQLGNNSVLNAGAPVLVSTSGTALAGKTVTAIAAGASHSLALCSDGTVAAWGLNLYGQLGNNSTSQSQIAVAVNTAGALSGKTVTAIAAGGTHSLARCSDGTLVAWGNNTNGQLGNNSTTQGNVPVAVTTTGTALAGKTVTAIAVGNSHSLALCSDGSVAAWGYNSSGQLGNNSTTLSLVAVPVSTSGALSGKTVSAISSVEGATHNLALCSDGTVVAWGLNTNGQLGIGSTTNSLVPVAVTTTGTALAGKTVSGISVGGNHSLLLFADGSAAACGANTNGQLGNDSTTQFTTATAVATPGTPLSGKTIASLSGGGSHSLALCSDGTTAAWGNNFSGQIGNSTLYAPTPVAVSAAGSAIVEKTLFSLSTGSAHSLALCSDGTVAAWGSNLNGQLGNGTTINSYVPAGVPMTGVLAGKTVVVIAAGTSHSMALCSDGTVATWGYNGYGQLGNNSTTQSTVPVAVTTSGVLAGKTVIAISAGQFHSLALCSDGTVAAWGYNFNGQLGNSSTTQSTVPVLVTMTGVLSGKTVTAIASGSSHNVVLCSDGTVAAWGYNGYGQLGNTSYTDSSVPVLVSTSGVLNGNVVTAIKAGSYHSLALCSGNTLAAWGQNTYGQLGNNGGGFSNVPVAVVTSGVLSGKVVSSIACGGYHNVALCSDGTVTAWGYAGDGELGNNSQIQSGVPVLVSSAYLASGERLVQAFSGQSSFTLGIVAGPPAAQILVQQPAGVNLTNGSSIVDFGSCLPGASTTRTFTLVNNGTAPLTISGVTFNGTNGADFAVTTPPASTVAVGGSTTFVVTFTPGAALSRSGVLQVSSNDPVNGSFAVNVAGAGDGTLAAVYGRATDIPLSATSFTATGSQVNITLNYAPTTGTNLMVVRNTGLGFINGTFSNLVQGQTVTINYNGYLYSFVANYYGGTGNDLVLQWAGNRLLGWGQDTYSQLGNNNPTNFLIPVGLTTTGVLAGKTVTKVAAGASHTLALCSDGTLAAWGGNVNGQLGNNSTTPSVVPVLVTTTGALSGKTVTAIAAGFGHSLALCSDGTVVGWGQNIDGQLGNNSTTQSTVPVAVTTSGVLSGKTVTAISVGSGHSIALCSDGTVAAWGYNSNGQLGNNSTTQSNVPVLVTTTGVLSGKTVTAIATGSAHNLARCSDGTVVSWGYNSNGQLGNNSTTQSTVPVAVTTTSTGLAGKSVSSISAGGFHSMALCSDGTVATWGMGGFGQLGNNLGADSYLAVAVNSYGSLVGKTVSGIAAGFYHSLVRCSDGSMVAWGYNLYGQLGNNSTTQSNLPVLVTTAVTPLSGKTVSLISAGQYHNIAICTDGTVAGWGNGVNGQLGNNVPLYFPTPVATTTAGTPLAGKTVIAESTGQYHSLALCSDGTLAAWGNNGNGQLGNGSTTNSLVPTPVSQLGLLSGKTVVAISAGSSHSLALCSDGTVAAWGSNSNGQLGNNSTTQSSTPVAVTTTGALAGKTVIAVAAGGFHSLALCTDGTVVAWGFNTYGQLGNNSTTQSTVPVAVSTSGTALAGKTVIAFSAGQYHSLGLCSDGTVTTWGANGNGQLGNNSTTQSTVPVLVSPAGTPLAGRTVTALAAGGNHSLALCSDGTLAAWGYNFYGQLGNNSTAQSTIPVAVTTSGTALAGKTVSAISAGLYHSAALCADGTAATWGYDVDGELGNNSTTNSLVPVAVSTAALAAGEVCVQAASGQGAYHTLALVASPLLPQFVVQQPAGTSLTSGSSTVNFGSSLIGTGTTQTFTLFNTGTAPLSLSSVTIDGTNAADFSVTTAPASSIAAGGSSTMTLTFTPGAGLGRSAALHFTSNDPANSPFNVALSGFGTFALAANYSSAATVPLTVSSLLATGSTVSFTLSYAPTQGAVLTVVNNTGIGFISGTFANLQQGQNVALSYGGKTYQFVANYYGGTGNDLVLQWAGNRPLAWGLNTYGQLGNNAATTFPAPVAVSTAGVLSGKTVVSIAAGQSHTVALCSDGTLAAWGFNTYGQLGNNSTTQSTVPVAVTTSGVLAGKTVTAVAAGSNHTLALCSDGTLAAWGYNTYGQLGNNATTNSSVPVAVTTSGVLAGKTVTAVSAGYYHSMAVCSDGTVAAWGYNFNGQLGNNSTTNSSVPVAVSTSGVLSGKTVTAVSAGYAHCLVRCSDGTVAAWGYNSSGQLGNNSTTQSTVPVAVTTSGVLAGKTVAAVAAGYYHSLALCSDGTVTAWGYNPYGQLGNNTTNPSVVPVAVTTSGVLAGKMVTAVAAGYYHSLALCSDGTVAAWGYNNNGQLSSNTYINSVLPLTVNTSGVLAGKTVTALAGGNNHSMAVCSDGTVAGWGSNSNGQLGNNSPTAFLVPVPVATAGTPLSGKTIIAYAAGNSHSLGLCSDGTLAAWGLNSNGQLGNNTTTYATVPAAVTTSGVLAGKTVVAVAAGYAHSLALCSDGTVAAWGYNGFGQLGNNTTTNSSVPVAVTTSGVLAGKTVVAVSAGYGHSVALCSDGTVAAWGYNTYGQLGNNSTTNSSVPVAVTTSGTALAGKTVVAVAAGYYNTVALCSDGTVAAWGYNTYGQLGNNTTTNSSVPVAVTTSGTALAGKTVTTVSAGYSHCLALCSDGTLAAWGYNGFGQLGNSSSTNSSVAVAVTTAGTALAGKTITSMSAGFYHSEALCSDGTVTTCGYNFDGELGNNSTSSSNVPVAVNTSSLTLGEQFVQSFTGPGAYHSLAIVAEPLPAPAIFVQPSVGANLTNGSSTVDFGGISVGSSVTQTFTVGNSGNAALSISGVTIDGVNAADFAVTSAPASILASGTTTTLGVTFTPGGTLGRNAALHLVSNDPNFSPFNISLAGTGASTVSATYNSAADVPVTTGLFDANGSTVNFTLNYAPVTGTTLTVVNNTGLGFINGAFSNLSHGQLVGLSYNGVTYQFVASYYGGTGNDLVLMWAGSRLMAWGYNYYGELGNNSTTSSSIPVAVSTAGTPLATRTLLALSPGYYHSLALCSDGTLASWGYNFYGQLGNNSTTNSSVPVAVTTAGTALAGKTVISVVAGLYHSMVLCSDDTIVTWGNNGNGQLGNNTTTNSSVPVAVITAGTPLAGKSVVAIITGNYHSLALCSDGTLASWGGNGYGQLGNNSTIQSNVPTTVTTAGTPLAGKTVVSAAAGGWHNIALCSDGTLVTWGENNYGQLGNNTTTNSSVPVAVTTAGTALAGKTVIAVAAGHYHSMALCSDGTVATWGYNFDGQLGNNSTTQSNVPVAVTTAGTALAGKTVTRLTAGYYQSVATCADGTIATWGYDSDGELGNNSTTQSNVPVAVSTIPLGTGESFMLVAGSQSALHSLSLVATPVPAVSTLAATMVGGSTAVLNGSVNANGGNAAVSFDYGLDTTYGTNVAGTPATVTGSTSTAVSAALTGLLPATTYHFRVNATNSGEQAIGGDQTFTTPNATLSALALNSGSLSPVFSPTVYGYTAAVGTGVASIAVTPTTSDINATVAVNGTAVISGSASNSIPLGYGDNTISIVVTAADQVSTQNYTVIVTRAVPTALTASYASSTDVPVSINAFTATGDTVNFALNYAPVPGTQLTVVRNTGLGFINGTFNNLAQGQAVGLSYNGVTYQFVANYYGGTGNDLVLVWAGSRAVAWGYNNYGELGNNSTTLSLVPGAVTTIGTPLASRTVLALSSGWSHSLALCSDGTLASWGYNGYGQLGNNTTTNSSVPIAVTTAGTPLAGKTVCAVSAGYGHNLALCTDGTLASWGFNVDSQLGNSTTTSSSLPVAVTTAGTPLAGKSVAVISAGGYHNLVICTDGTLVAWGYNFYGQLGNNTTTTSSVPVAVTTAGTPLLGKNIVSVAAGGYHNLALCSDGTLATWGENNYGQLGNNTTTNSSVPVAVSTAGTALAGKTVIAVAAGQYHSMALCSDGTIATWGYNLYGQLGNNSTANSTVPVAVSTSGVLAGKTVIRLTAGYDHSLAVCADGTIATWGDNGEGELGNNSLTQSNVPVAVSASALGAGESFMLVAGGQSALHNLGLVATPVPSASTLAATMVGGSTAVLNGAVNANGGNAAVSFDYGLDTTYGTNVAGTPATATGSTSTAVSMSLTGLMPGTTYHFRVNASNSGELATGGDQTFTTANATLSSLALSTGSLSPVFSPTVYSYTSAVGGAVASIAVTPTTSDSNATVVVNGVAVSSGSASTPIALIPGDNMISIVVTAADQVSTQNYTVIVTRAVPTALTATFGSSADVPVTGSNITIAGSTVNFVLNYAPVTGTQLTVVNNTGFGFINGKFSNLAQGQVVGVSYNGATYNFVANYYGGTGNDLVLVWAGRRPVAWGDNSYGDLGNNSTTSSSSSVAVKTAGTPLATRSVLALSSGWEHSLALCSDGTVASWGYNVFGQLGNNTTTDSSLPLAVTTTGTPLAGKVVCAVSAGYEHNLALCTDGTLASWGYNVFGQLGNNTTTNSSVPVAVTTAGTPLAVKSVVAVGTGTFHSLALCSDGTLATWGYNTYGQLGNNTTTNSSVPVAVTTAGTPLAGKTVASAASGGNHILALCTDGTLVSWGSNNNGQLGNNTTTNSSVPVAVTTAGTALAGKTVIAVAAGQYHSMALCSDGTIAAWGYNSSGQLGNTSTTQSSVPVAVTTTGTVLAGKSVVAISAGYYYSMATCSDGTIANWGDNTSGQLGNNSTTNSTVPVPVSTSALGAGESFMLVEGGQSADHSLALVATPVPSATTLAATSVTGTSALLNGTVNANGGSSTVSFDYGLDTTYGTNVAGTPANVLGSTDTAASAALTGLLPATTYHYRVNVSNSGAVASGGDMTFTTANVCLSSLSLSAGSLSPAFGPATYSYTTSVGSAVSSITVTPTTADTNATVALNGTAVTSGIASSPVPLGYGNNTLTIVVTGADQVSTLTYSVSILRTIPNPLPVSYASGSDVPVSVNGFIATGSTINFALNYAPVTGAQLTVVNNTGLGFINGKFSNLAQGQVVGLSYNGVTYQFVANYYGGTGNDLVLVWAGSRAVAWGFNYYGEVGNNNSPYDSYIPTAVTTVSTPLANRTVVALSAGEYHSLAVCSDGTLASWGWNAFGQLGNSTTTDSSLPAAVTTAGTPLAGKFVIAASGGFSHSIVLCSDGTLAGWGRNASGEVGNNTTTSTSVPVAVTTAGTPLAGKSVVAISSGVYHNLSLCSDGTLVSWGWNAFGQLGNNSTNDSSVPVAVTTVGTPLAGKTVVSLVAGGNHNLVLCSDGTLVVWGGNNYGQLGIGTNTDCHVPTTLPTAGTVLAGKTLVAVAAGQNHSVVLCSDGTLATWGYNNNGQLGNTTTTSSNVPVLVTTAGTVLAGKTVVSVSAYNLNSMAACSDGTLTSWGYNNDGQLGNNSFSQSNVPVAVSTSTLAAGERFMSVVVGQSALHNLALVATPVPAATTLAATSVTGTSALLNGTVNANGGTVAVSFDYGLDTTYGTNVAATPATATGNTGTAVSVSLTGLLPGTTYHFRVNSTGGSGTANGADLTFTTPDTQANLASLALSSGTLSPVFSSTVLAYSVAMSNATTSFTVTPTAASSLAAITVNGTAVASGAASLPIAFSGSSATVSIVVTAQDGTTIQTYTLNINRYLSFLDWAAANNLPTTDLTADTDGDGIPNLLEYAFNSNPASAGQNLLPAMVSTLNPADSKHYFTYTYRRRIAPGTMTYSIESSANLGSWSAVAAQNLQQVGPATSAGDGVSEVVTFRLLPALEDGPAANFVRLKVTP